MKKVLAFDYGASSGRAILGSFDGSKLNLTEMHRFPNEPVMVNNSFHWDILRLYHELKRGILECIKNGHQDIVSMGIDTWGVDFGLLDNRGNLLGNPYHYRDSRTAGMMEAAFGKVSKDEIYQTTGISFNVFNTLYQLLAMKEQNSPQLEKAETLLFTPDLLNYFLTGEKVSEYTIASTSQMLQATERDWAKEMLVKLNLPTGILAKIVQPGTRLGGLRKELVTEFNCCEMQVVSVAEHDTGSAVAAIPAENEKYAYISSGTWSLLGVESPTPLITPATAELNYTNEGGINGTYRLLKNIIGLWIYQECKRSWDKNGVSTGFAELEAMAENATPFASLIDPDHSLFYGPGNMPEKIRDFCRSTGQKVPETKGEIVRSITESLALKYRIALEGLEEILGYQLPVIHVVGGGSQNKMLNQFTADATGKPVIAGPVEATAIGNIIAQLIAIGEIANLREARSIVKASFPVREYLPNHTCAWDDALDKFLKLCLN